MMPTLLPMLLTAAPAASAGAASAAEPVSFIGELVAILVPLVFIILVLLAVLRFAKRRYGPTGHDMPLSIVQVLALGPRERLVLVKTRTGRLFAVGVSGQSVNLVTDLDPLDLAPTEAAGEASASPVAKVFGLPLNRRDLSAAGRSGPRTDGSE